MNGLYLLNFYNKNYNSVNSKSKIGIEFKT